MKDLLIYGSGGFAREVLHLIEQINLERNKWNILGFLDDNKENLGKKVNGYDVIGGIEWALKQEKMISVVIGIGSPAVKKKLVDSLSENQFLDFPNIIHPDVYISEHNILGKGNIICEGTILTCNIQVHNFITINLNCTIGHDVIIADYCTIAPNSSISGNVHLCEGVDFGTNSTVIQGITIGRSTIVGAGAVVVRDLPDYCTAIGIPARPIKFQNEVISSIN